MAIKWSFNLGKFVKTLSISSYKSINKDSGQISSLDWYLSICLYLSLKKSYGLDLISKERIQVEIQKKIKKNLRES